MKNKTIWIIIGIGILLLIIINIIVIVGNNLLKKAIITANEKSGHVTGIKDLIKLIIKQTKASIRSFLGIDPGPIIDDVKFPSDYEDLCKLCYYHIPSACIPEKFGGCGMHWEALPLRTYIPCEDYKDCIALGPSYKNWTIDEVKCEVDNRKCCVTDEDCVLGGTCCYIKACYNKDYWEDYTKSNCEGLCDEPQKDPAYPYSGCKCVNHYCVEIEEKCGKEAEMYSDVFTDKYPEHCCEGLTEWYSGMAFGISIGNKCYDTVRIGGAPYGTCINCGNGICEDIEDICNCPEDCPNGENSQYSTTEEFCEAEKSSFVGICKENLYNLSICDLCEWS